MKRNPKSPWNPADVLDVSPADYERQVIAWLRSAASELKSFNIGHLVNLKGSGGEYEFDAVAELQILEGATVRILVECKRHSRPVEREALMVLESKLRDIGAHKAMLFSTAGFQSGAIQFATTKGIACVTFVDGTFSYEARSLHRPQILPTSGKFEAMLLKSPDESTMNISHIRDGHVAPLTDWINGN